MDTERPDSERDLADARLRDLFGALADEGEARPGPDAGRVAGHLAGVGDAALLEDAARDPAIRRLLAEIVREVPAAERDAATAAGPSEAVLARVVAAWPPSPARAERPVPTSATGLRRAVTVTLRRVAVAAAVTLAAVQAWRLLAPGVEDSGPSMPIEAIDRLAADGGVTAEGPQRLAVGTRVRTAPGEVVAVTLPGGGRVVLQGGPDGTEGARVVCAAPTSSGCAAFGLSLERGEALVAAPADAKSSPPVLLLPDGSRLEIAAGAARVAVSERGPAVELDGAGRGRWTSARGQSTDLVGPRVLGDVPAPGGLPFSTLGRFDGARRAAPTERFVGARQWRILPGSFERTRRGDAAGMPALRATLAPGTEARMAWRPDDEARGARVAVVRLVARPAAAAASGAAGPRLRLSVEGVPGAEVVVDHSGSPSDEVRRVEIPLPHGWGASLAECVLSVAADGDAVADVLGVVFPSPFRDAVEPIARGS